jgi:hypothetical protein
MALHVALQPGLNYNGDVEVDVERSAASGASPSTGELVAAYAARVRGTPGLAVPNVISYAGLWLLLATLSPVASGSIARQLAEILGVVPGEAAARAEALLSDPHPALGTALGAWARNVLALDADLLARLPVPVQALPAQEVLDRWAAERTRGLIREFPVTVTAETLLILASALVAQVEWTQKLGEDDDGWLVLRDGLQALVHTERAGVVAVARPLTEDGVDVVSVIAARDVPQPAVWQAVDEIVVQLNDGAIPDQMAPTAITEGGHAWNVREETRSFQDADDPGLGAEMWRSLLPRWKAQAETDLTDAPGVGAVAAALAPGMSERAVATTCVQAAVASYDEAGFSAAAVTAIVMLTGVPTWVKRPVRLVELKFDRPHAVVAIARGGAWEGIPIFHAWVDPAQRLTEAVENPGAERT